MPRERRAFERCRLVFPVLLEGPHGLRRCVARDVSARGLFVETFDRYDLGSPVRVTFALPDGSWEMSVRCTVRRIVRLDAADGMLHGIGLSFEEITDDAEGDSPPPRRIHA